MKIAKIGIDLAKNVIQMHGVKETVSLCEAAVNSNPFSPQLPDAAAPALTAMAKPQGCLPLLH